MNENRVREVFYFENYFLDFYESLKPEVQLKVLWTIDLITRVERVPVKFFKHLQGTKGLYEIRVEVGTDIYRVFSFFDEGKLVILINGFQKKDQKTPKKEIEKALKLKSEYFYGKEK